MNTLCFDIGNTLTKVAVFKNNQMVHFRVIEKDNYTFIPGIINENKIEEAILSSVSVVPGSLSDMLHRQLKKVVYLDHTQRLPIENCYETKETLGKDRLAAVVGANHLYPASDLLVIDAGTAITYDIINYKGQYLGGNISPGIQMRFRALNHFTEKLPLLEKSDSYPLFGKNTQDAIRTGVQQGVIFEVEGTIDHYKRIYENLKVLFTGGDAKFFEHKLKNTIFVVPNLVLIGLNKILMYDGNHPN